MRVSGKCGQRRELCSRCCHLCVLAAFVLCVVPSGLVFHPCGSLLCLSSYHSRSPHPSSSPSLCLGCMGTFHAGAQGFFYKLHKRSVFCSRSGLEQGALGSCHIQGLSPCGGEHRSSLLRSLHRGQGVLQCSAPSSELGLGERELASFSFTPRGQSPLPSNSPPSPKPGKHLFNLQVRLFKFLRCFP